MKVKVNKNELKEAISKINKIMKKENLLLYSKLICLDVRNDQILLSVVQHAISMRTKIDNIIMDEPFSCLFDGNMVMALLAKMPSENVILSYDKEKMELILKDESHAKMKLRCNDKAQFAGWKELESPDFEKKTDILFHYIAACKHALPTKDSNDIMSSFCIQYGANRWKITAIDGSRISSRGDISNIENTILVPGNIITMLEGIFQNKFVIISMKNEDIWIRDEITEVYLRTVSGKYFNLENIIDTEYKYKITLDRAELEYVLTLAHVSLLNETLKVGVLTFNGNSMEITTSDRIGNEMKNVISYDGNVNGSIRVGMNLKFMLDAVKSIPDDTITLELISEVHPMKISGEEYLEIVLPTKLKA